DQTLCRRQFPIYRDCNETDRAHSETDPKETHVNEYDTYDTTDTDPRGGRRGRRGRPTFDGPPPFARAMAGRRGGPHLDGPWGRFPMGPMGPGRGRRRGRRSRGDVRAAVLALLAEQPMHGYQII